MLAKAISSSTCAFMAALLGAAFVHGPAAADPCRAVPDRGPTPDYLAPGQSFSGPVVYVGDGDSLCVDVGGGPDAWVEVRLADFYASELKSADGLTAKQALEDATRGRNLDCVAQDRSYDRVVALCVLDGRSVGDLLRDAGEREGGRGYGDLTPSNAASANATPEPPGAIAPPEPGSVPAANLSGPSPTWRVASDTAIAPDPIRFFTSRLEAAFAWLERLPAVALIAVFAALIGTLIGIWLGPSRRARRRRPGHVRRRSTPKGRGSRKSPAAAARPSRAPRSTPKAKR